jgi:hypothetical protein
VSMNLLLLLLSSKQKLVKDNKTSTQLCVWGLGYYMKLEYIFCGIIIL